MSLTADSPTSATDAWSFLTTHALVLLYVARHPLARVRDIAADLELTERTVYRVLGELEEDGYIDREREGRRLQIQIDHTKPLRAPHVGAVTLPGLLALLTETDDTA